MGVHSFGVNLYSQDCKTSRNKKIVLWYGAKEMSMSNRLGVHRECDRRTDGQIFS